MQVAMGVEVVKALQNSEGVNQKTPEP